MPPFLDRSHGWFKPWLEDCRNMSWLASGREALIASQRQRATRDSLKELHAVLAWSPSSHDEQPQLSKDIDAVPAHDTAMAWLQQAYVRIEATAGVPTAVAVMDFQGRPKQQLTGVWKSLSQVDAVRRFHQDKGNFHKYRAEVIRTWVQFACERLEHGLKSLDAGPALRPGPAPLPPPQEPDDLPDAPALAHPGYVQDDLIPIHQYIMHAKEPAPRSSPPRASHGELWRRARECRDAMLSSGGVHPAMRITRRLLDGYNSTVGDRDFEICDLINQWVSMNEKKAMPFNQGALKEMLTPALFSAQQKLADYRRAAAEHALWTSDQVLPGGRPADARNRILRELADCRWDCLQFQQAMQQTEDMLDDHDYEDDDYVCAISVTRLHFCARLGELERILSRAAANYRRTLGVSKGNVRRKEEQDPACGDAPS